MEGFLRDRGIAVDRHDSLEAREYAGLLVEAEMENLQRTHDLLIGEITKTSNPLWPSRQEMEHPEGVQTLIKPEKKINVGQLCEAFMERKMKEGLSVRTMKGVAPTMGAMVEFFGKNTLLKSITTVQGEEYINFLMRIPKNSKKRYPRLSLRQSIEKEARKQTPMLLSRATLDKYFTWTQLCFSSAQAILHLEFDFPNPLRPEYRKLFPKKIEREETPMFTVEQLQEIFTSNEYREAFASPKRGKFWIPLLCLFQGFRLDEAAQLTVSNLVYHKEIPCLRITTLAADGQTVIKRIKRPSSRRDVPVHPEIIKLGFLQFIEGIKKNSASPDEQLFPECPLNLNAPNSIGDRVGDWFRVEVRDRLFDNMQGKNGRSPALHSFRHAWRTALRRARVNLSEVETLGGWSSVAKSQEAGYGEQIWEHLHEDIQKVEYPGLDLPSLYYETE